MAINFPSNPTVGTTWRYGIRTWVWNGQAWQLQINPAFGIGDTSIPGNLTVAGNLTVNGATTTLNANTLTIDDKNITLGNVISASNLQATLTQGSTTVVLTSGTTAGMLVGQAITGVTGAGAFGASPTIASVTDTKTFTVSVAHATTGAVTFSTGATTDFSANGGGLTLLGTTSKTFTWVSSTSAWTSSENFDIATGKTYKIAGSDIISGTAAALVVGSGASTSLTLGSASGSTTVTGSTLTLGSASGTGTFKPATLVLDSSGTASIQFANATTITYTAPSASTVNFHTMNTGNVTLNLVSAATASGNTKTINFGANGVSGSITNINFGPVILGATSTFVLGSSANAANQTNTIYGATTLASAVTFSSAVTLSSTINKVTITAPATAATLTLANNSTLTTAANFTTTTAAITLAANAAGSSVTLPASGTLMSNPMTTLGDFIYGGASGAATRLAGNTTTTPQFLTSTGSAGAATAPTLTGSTGSGNVVLATAPTIAGGSLTGLTTLAIRDTSAAFDVTLAGTSSVTLTAGRTLTIDVANANRTLSLANNLTITSTGAISLTGAAGGSTITLPSTGTLLTTTSLSSGLTSFGTSPTLTTPTVNNPTLGSTTATLPSIKLNTSGTLLTTAAGGAVEYDGNGLYFTPNSNVASNTAYGGRGILDTTMVAALNSTVTLNSTSTSAQAMFASGSGSLNNGYFAVAPTTAYLVDMVIYFTKGSTATNMTISFPPGPSGNGASTTFTNFSLYSSLAGAATNTPVTGSMSYNFGTTATPSVAITTGTTNTTTAGYITVKGIIRINASTSGQGVIIPSITFSVATGASPTILQGSYIELTPIGTNTQNTVGAWS